MPLNRRCALLAMFGGAGASLSPLVGAEALPSLIARCRRSVVLVGTYAESDSPRFTFRGTGFAVLDGRTIVTNAHVLPAFEDGGAQLRTVAVQVPTDDGQWELRRASRASSDQLADLATLTLEGRPLPALTMAEGMAAEGEGVALLGFPMGGALGFTLVTHTGIISGIPAISLPSPTSGQLSAQALRLLREGAFKIYQLDATAYPGNSGGPLIAMGSGEVIGVVSMVAVKGARESAITSPTGISYAVPSTRLLRLLKGS